MEIALAATRAAAGGSSGGVNTVLPAAVLGSVLIALAITWLLLRPADADGALRRCPHCAADAVADGEFAWIDELQMLVRLRCGQCGAWRHLVMMHLAARQLYRTLDADRQALADSASRMERERATSDIDGFERALRRDVVGGDDFLALTRRGGGATDSDRPGSPR